ncbi:hypothetical protein ADH76_31690 [Enterocloster clostridioformis]|uniref:hypothetical protein n=1 Tax=Enterocloster clostridioformis TaxID=1531 RepID=UPI00080C7F91|nr:hypothetical protein [Enterocloster clostridioformis]ANU46810.1 hypothetical protein A4V08_14310 [Lachnoclostridium sp. YL32]NDO26881.1 hypothetical protein [Enterocloster clostridioformis]OXE62401.1 hypothetical protein ADH76_31690 [Enterocloster clostridioformis]QQQ98484.1 hypothetical protein I5Q83_20285 [Enterocloster clostridioformis]
MGNWKDNNLSAILEYPFDFKRYMEERLREIDDLDERQFAKKLLIEGLGKVIGCTEEKYRQLERRVYEELEIADNQYESVMTIISRSHYDPTNKTLYPVLAEDLKEAQLKQLLSDDHRIWLGTIFLEVEEGRQRGFEEKQPFPAVPASGEGKQETMLSVQLAGRYRDAVEGLYEIFQDNHIPWETINTGYLDKFYDVYLDKNETGKGFETMALKDMQIEWGIYREAVRYELIPLWNMEWVRFDSADFMLPCISGIYYEHEFSLEDKEEKDGYLIQANEDILEIRHEKKKIVIKSQKETFENWRVLHIIQGETARSLDYDAPLLTNHKRDSFIRRHSENSRVQLMTKTDLFRRIMELDIRDYIEVVGYEIKENAGDYPNAEGMNWFVRDELFPMESRKVLLLKFQEKQPGHYLNESMVRFVISQMQLEISEYRCVGVIL